MKNAMIKNNLREIARTPGRYIAIVCIIALGVGFFSGLTITKQTMLETGNDYVTGSQLYDFKLISTVGFDDDDIAALSAVDSVRAAEGAYGFDFLERAGDAQRVMTALSLTDSLNALTLEAGRLPENPDECVADGRVFSEDSIGQTVMLSSENSEDTLGSFAYDEYTIVGIASSPEYMQMQRGTSKLGNGKVSGYVYLLPEGFDSQYYTAAYVKLDSDYYIFSDEYDDNMEAVKPAVTSAAEISVNGRFDRLYNEAADEIASAEQEYNDGVADLKQAEADYAEGLAEIEQAEKDYADGMTELNQAENDYAAAAEELKQGEADCDAAEAELNTAQAELDSKAGELAQSRSAFEALKLSGMADSATLAAYEVQLAAGEAEIAAAQAQLDGAKQELASSRGEIASGRAELESHKADIESAKTELAEGLKEIEDGKAELADGKKEIDDGWAELADGEKKIADAKADLAELERPSIYTLTRYENAGYSSYESDSSIVEGIAKVFPIIFFLVAALVCSTTMTKMVDEGRTQIGTLKAMGYGKGAIMGKYIGYSGSAAILGALAGFFSCTKLFPTVIWIAYTMMYDFTDSLKYVFDGGLLVISLGAALLCSVGVTFFSCYGSLEEKPAELIRPKAPKAGKRILLERIPFLWKHFKFLHKVSIRNIFRYKKRLIMMMLGIGGCTALVVVGFGLRDSIQNLVYYQYDEITKYDMSVTLQDPADGDFITQFTGDTADYVEKSMLVHESSAEVAVSNGILPVQLIAADDPGFTEMIDLHYEDEPVSYPSDGEAVINRKTAELGGYAVGDTLEIRVGEGENFTVTISGVCESYVSNYVYVTTDTYRDGLGYAPEEKTVYASLTKGKDPHEAAAAVMNLSGIANVSLSEDMKTHVSDMMKSMNYVIILVIGCAAALAFVVLFNLSNINITERAREIATIKVLGFYPSEVSQYVFRENILLTVLGTIVGLPLGAVLHRFVMGEIKIAMVTFEVRIAPESYIISVILTFVFTILVGIIMKPKLAKISMAESLKSVE